MFYALKRAIGSFLVLHTFSSYYFYTKIETMSIQRIIISILFMMITITMFSQNKDNYIKSHVDFDAFKTLVEEVEEHRKERLIGLDEFLEMKEDSEFIILDSRSEKMYKQKHIKGAVHLNFSDFNQYSLLELFPDSDTKILIYCNNNIEDDAISFMTKTVVPSVIDKDIQELTLALNIPTYINLYGYGYINVYELDELISIYDERIEFEGTEVLNKRINN